jgi:hypothetical protein
MEVLRIKGNLQNICLNLHEGQPPSKVSQRNPSDLRVTRKRFNPRIGLPKLSLHFAPDAQNSNLMAGVEVKESGELPDGLL